MALEAEAVSTRELFHFRMNDRVLSRSPKASQVGVVNDAEGSGMLKVSERFMKKTFHLEAVYERRCQEENTSPDRRAERFFPASSPGSSLKLAFGTVGCH